MKDQRAANSAGEDGRKNNFDQNKKLEQQPRANIQLKPKGEVNLPYGICTEGNRKPQKAFKSDNNITFYILARLFWLYEQN